MAASTLLLPKLSQLRGAGRSATLELLLVRGRSLSRLEPGLRGLLSGLIENHPGPAAVAPVTALADGLGRQAATWLRADPAYVRADMAAARLLMCGGFALEPEQVTQLTRALSPLFGDEGFELHAPDPERWYLRLPRESKLPAFAAPEDVLGDDLHAHLPEGDLGKRWRRLLNEAQIVLHNHPINVARAEQRLAPVNSVWFWGAGSLPDSVKTGLGGIVSDDPYLRGLAQLANVHGCGLDSYDQESMSQPNKLFDLRGVRRSEELEARWLAPMLQALRDKRLERVLLRFGDGEYRGAGRSDLWKFWLRPKP
jgi:hypothetical protein